MAYTINKASASGASQGLTITNGSQNTITLGNLFTTWNSTLDELKSSGRYKKYEIIESEEDLLALSCTVHRRKSTPSLERGYQTVSGSLLLNDYTYQQVNHEDRELASKIRSFYNQKFMVMTLKEHKLTKYREDLQRFLVGDGKKFVEKDIGMIYYLPQFYEFDQKFLDLKDKFYKPKSLERYNDTKQLTLQPVDSLLRVVKHSKTKLYWFKDTENVAYCYKVLANNTLLPFMDREFSNTKITLTCHLNPRRTEDDFWYYEITKISNI